MKWREEDEEKLHWLNDEQPGAGCVPIAWAFISLALLAGGALLYVVRLWL